MRDDLESDFAVRKLLWYLRREERRSWLNAVLLLAAGAAAVVIATTVYSSGLIWGVVLAAPLIATFFMLTATRARYVRLSLRNEYRRVLAVGWSRAPDGCNYAVFPLDSDTTTRDPDLVIRLATVRPTRTTVALLADAPAWPWDAAALFAEDGEILAVGRVRKHDNGVRVWSRRNQDTPWWSMNPGRNSPPSDHA